VRRRRIARSHDIGREVLQQHRAHARHAVRAHAAVLVHAGEAAQDHVVADMDVAGELG